ncbi:Fision threonyl-tRNA synthetase, partial [human gut metagenome]
KDIKSRMQEIIDKDIPIKRIKVSKEKAIEIFSNYNMEDKVKLLQTCKMEEFLYIFSFQVHYQIQ